MKIFRTYESIVHIRIFFRKYGYTNIRWEVFPKLGLAKQWLLRAEDYKLLVFVSRTSILALSCKYLFSSLTTLWAKVFRFRSLTPGSTSASVAAAVCRRFWRVSWSVWTSDGPGPDLRLRAVRIVRHLPLIRSANVAMSLGTRGNKK